MCSSYSVIVVLLLLSWPVTAALSWFPYPGFYKLAVLSVTVALVLMVLIWPSYDIPLALAALSWLSFSISCPGFFSWLSCPCSPFLAILSWLFRLGRRALTPGFPHGISCRRSTCNRGIQRNSACEIPAEIRGMKCRIFIPKNITLPSTP